MTKVLEFGPGDAAQCRFAISPVWETVSAVRVLREPHRQRYHLPWLEAVRPQVQGIDVAPLTA
ncbi:MAG TPA: hypothetical protein VHT30_04820 [Acidimicrobiales bacterium]|jgi:hypothetical protein|nr:hypothetical protein [Acidimicrobiales bacterium]